MGIENQIAQFGMNAGRGVQNTINNALARNEDRRRYENSLSLAKQQQAMAGEAAADAAEREYSAGGVQAYMSSGKDPRILQGWAQGAVQRGYITPEEASAFDDSAMMRLAAEVGHDFSRKDVKLPSNVQEWEYYSQLPQDKQNQYLNMKRAGNMINLQDKMVYRGPGGDIQGAYPVGIKPSDTVGHRVSVKRGESEAAADVQERVGAAKLARQNERAMATYESAIG